MVLLPTEDYRDSSDKSSYWQMGADKAGLFVLYVAGRSAESGFPELPSELGELVKRIGEFEKTDTWSRYEVSKNKGGIVQHSEEEVVLPIVEIQRRLEFVVSKTTYRFDNEDAYENVLYYEWESAARATGRAG